MLGDSTLRQWYASADSLTVKPKVICEWNANDYAKLAVFGHGDGAANSISNFSRTYTYKDPATGAQDFDSYSILSEQSVSGLDNSYRLAFAAKATGSPIELTLIAEARDSSGKIRNSFSKTISVYTSEKQWFYIDAFTRDTSVEVSKITFKVMGFNQSYSSGITVNFTDLAWYTISKSETSKSLYTSLGDVFSSNRPGEAYLDKLDTDLINSNVFPQHLSMYNFVNTIVSGGTSTQLPTVPLYKCRDIMPNSRSAFKYYFYQNSGTVGSTVTKYIFAKYENSFKSNKIVIKINAVENIPSIKVSTWDGSSWSSDSSSYSPQSNGLLVLYWNGSSWSDTKWSSIPQYAVASPFDGVPLKGIKLTLASTIAGTKFDEVHISEISPRLELDLSNYVNSYSISKELSSDSYPTPIGTPNSNVASVEFNNIPEYDGTIPFDQYDTNHPLYNLMKKNVKIKILAKPFDSDSNKSETLLGVFYSKSWTFNAIESVSVEAYDAIKDLTVTICPVLYLKNTSPAKIISILLDNVGFTDYVYDELMGESGIASKVTNTIPHFWTIKDKSVLDVIKSICLPYQIMCYVDEYGVLRFKHISDISSSNVIQDYMITDDTTTFNGNLVKSNIISLSENQESHPSSLSVEYTDVQPYAYNEVTAENATVKSQQNVDLWQAPQGQVGFIRIAGFVFSSTANYIKYKYEDGKSAIDSFSGYILIDKEIVKFDGVEFKFIQNHSQGSTTYTHVVKSYGEVDQLRSKYLLDATKTVYSVDVKYIIGGLVTLRNLTRGCFGTAVTNHAPSISFIYRKDNPGRSEITADSFTSITDGLLISKDVSSTLERKVALWNSPASKEYRIISGSFNVKDYVVPSDGTPIEFGIAAGATNSTSVKNGLYVGIQMSKKSTKTNGVAKTVYTESLVIKQYNSSGTKILDKATVINRSEDKDIDLLENKSGGFINFAGENSITLYFSNSNIAESSSYDRIMVVINGNIVTPSSSTISIKNEKTNQIKYFPAQVLGEKVDYSSDKYFGAYSNCKTSVILTNLEAVGSVNDSISDSSRNDLTLLSSIIYGNAQGISDKNEVDATVIGQVVDDHIESKGFKARIFGREIKVFDIEFNSYPVTFAKILRNSYDTYDSVSDGNGQYVTYVQRVPSDAVTFSVFDSSPVSARFAMINSYNKPVLINGTDTSGSTAATITMLKGQVLVPSQNGVVSNIIDRNTTDGSEIKIQSDWIQSRIDATSVLDKISKYAIMKRANLEVELFGNPLITVGDILNLTYNQRNIVDGKFIVMAVKQSFDSGISTSVTLRRIEE